MGRIMLVEDQGECMAAYSDMGPAKSWKINGWNLKITI